MTDSTRKEEFDEKTKLGWALPWIRAPQDQQQAEMRRQFEATRGERHRKLQPGVPDRWGPNGEKVFDPPHESLSDPPFDKIAVSQPSLSDIMSELKSMREQMIRWNDDYIALIGTGRLELMALREEVRAFYDNELSDKIRTVSDVVGPR